MYRIAISTLAAQNISSPLLIYTYTADMVREVFFRISASGLAGNGAYAACCTVQLAGAGAFYQTPTSSCTIASGVTTLSYSTIPIMVNTGDVVRVYLQGQTADTSVAINTEVFDASFVAGSDGIVHADVTQWLTGTPAALTASGYIQSALLRWLTDNAAGTPNALASGRVDGSTGAMASDVVTAAALAADAVTELVTAIMGGSMSSYEETAAAQSLCNAILKQTGRIKDDAGVLKTYRTNGTTLQLSQNITTDASKLPITELGLGA